jgi:hypothetical protein
MGEAKRMDARCIACGHVWTMVHLPAPMSIVPKFAKLPCPKCHAPKPVMAGKDDMTTEDTLRAILRRAHDAMTRRDPDGFTTEAWDQLVADMAKELGMTHA